MATASTSKTFKQCVTCGIKESDQVKLVYCSLCASEKHVRTFYCSKACQKKDWKAGHKMQHRTTKAMSKMITEMSGIEAIGPATKWKSRNDLVCTTDRSDTKSGYMGLVLLGRKYSKIRKDEKAARKFMQAISSAPDRYEAYEGLGNTYADVINYREAIKAFIHVVKLSEEGSYAWNCSLNFILAHTAIDKWRNMDADASKNSDILHASTAFPPISPEDAPAWLSDRKELLRMVMISAKKSSEEGLFLVKC